MKCSEPVKNICHQAAVAGAARQCDITITFFNNKTGPNETALNGDLMSAIKMSLKEAYTSIRGA